ncbi:MAG: hypothetical protein NTY48_04545 [Candidatus Diapherotrites archaeon]|nr:hypothetical protein [Candidatus Diapherotrites archaeon]
MKKTRINNGLLLTIVVALGIVLLFGCTNSGNSNLTGNVNSNQDNVKQQYFSFLEKYISDKHNYVAEYEVVDNSPPQPEQYWTPNGTIYAQKFTPIMKLNAMTVFFLSDQTKFDIRTDMRITTNLTNANHESETLTTQSFVLSDYNKSYMCTKGKCVEQKINSPLVMPTREQATAALKDQNITIELMPKIAELPLDATCYQIVQTKMINCYLDDGVLAYMGNDTAHIKIKNIQRDVLTDVNFALPSIPTQS